MMESFASSFCTELDVEMFDAMDRMEGNLKKKKSNTPKNRKCQLQVSTNKSSLVPAKSINGASGSSVFINRTSRHSNMSVNEPSGSIDRNVSDKNSTDVAQGSKSSGYKFKDSNTELFVKGKECCRSSYNPYQPATSEELKPKQSDGHSRESSSMFNSNSLQNEAFKSPVVTNIVRSHNSSRSVKHLQSTDNITWQTPKVASTPAGPHMGGRGQQGKLTESATKRQSQLFKSLFTLQNSMNLSDIILSPNVDDGNKKMNQKGKDSKNRTPLKDKGGSIQNCKKTIFKDKPDQVEKPDEPQNGRQYDSQEKVKDNKEGYNENMITKNSSMNGKKKFSQYLESAVIFTKKIIHVKLTIRYDILLFFVTLSKKDFTQITFCEIDARPFLL